LALETLKPLARTHAFISGVPIGEEMIKLGYENVSQIALDRRGKMFIAISFSNDDDTIIKVSDEHVWFTVEEALLFDEIRQANARKRAAMRKNNDEKEEDEKVIEIARSNPNALKVIVDLSYEHDSARALRSVAKQLCEITSVGKKSKGDLRVTFASFAGDIKYESETFFNADTWSAHVEMLSDPAEECDVVACQEEGQTKNNIIYLSPDAETPLSLSELRDPSNIFVVGGIVDLKTRGMKTSKKKASSLGVQSRKLPVKTLRPDQTHDVLNIDTVVKILRSAWTMDEERGEDDDDEKKGGFHRAFDEVLPKRQGKEKPKRLKR
jgi:Trm5-related predicted tRNA methylase